MHAHACAAGPANAGKHRRIALLTAAWTVGVLCGLLASALLPSTAHAPPAPGNIGTTLATAPPRRSAGLRAHLATATAASERLAAGLAQPRAQGEPAAGVLVLYSFFEGDEESWGNLHFFVRHAVQDGDGAQYILVLNGRHDLADRRLPRLPANARYVLHKNECYDWGTYAWALHDQAKPADYECAAARLLSLVLHVVGAVACVGQRCAIT